MNTSDIIAQLINQTAEVNDHIDKLLLDYSTNLNTIEKLNKIVANNAEAIHQINELHLHEVGNSMVKAELKMLIKALERCINDNPGIIPLLEKYGISSVKEEDMVNVTGNNNRLRRR